MTRDIQTTLGDLISLFYDEFYALYGDEELASLAAASVINDMLYDAESTPAHSLDAAA